MPPNANLPYFSSFLDTAEHRLQSALYKKFAPIVAMVVPAALCAGVAKVLGAILNVNGNISLLLVGLSLALLAFPLGRLYKILKSPQTPIESLHKQALIAIEAFKGIRYHNKFHKRLDFAAAQYMEAASYYAIEIEKRLSDPLWNSPTTPLHLRSARIEVQESVETAMYEALILVQRCIAPDHYKDSFMDNFVENFSGLNVDSILDGIRDALRASKMYRSPAFDEVSKDLDAIVSRIKGIYTKIDEITTKERQQITYSEASPARSLDAALRNLSDIQRAENELTEDPTRIQE